MHLTDSFGYAICFLLGVVFTLELWVAWPTIKKHIIYLLRKL